MTLPSLLAGAGSTPQPSTPETATLGTGSTPPVRRKRSAEKGQAITGLSTRADVALVDVALVIAAAAIPGITVGVLRAHLVGGVLVGCRWVLVGVGTALVFRFLLRMINMEE